MSSSCRPGKWRTCVRSPIHSLTKKPRFALDMSANRGKEKFGSRTSARDGQRLTLAAAAPPFERLADVAATTAIVRVGLGVDAGARARLEFVRTDAAAIGAVRAAWSAIVAASAG